MKQLQAGPERRRCSAWYCGAQLVDLRLSRWTTRKRTASFTARHRTPTNMPRPRCAEHPFPPGLPVPASGVAGGAESGDVGGRDDLDVRSTEDMASDRPSPAYDRVNERRRAIALARHFREAEGFSIAQIAARLGRSPATVKAYFYDPI